MIFLYNPKTNRVDSFKMDESQAQLSAEEWPDVIYFFGKLAVGITIEADFSDFNKSNDLIEALNLIVPYFADNVRVSNAIAE